MYRGCASFSQWGVCSCWWRSHSGHMLSTASRPQTRRQRRPEQRCGFASLDVEALKIIWERDYDQIIYIAQELAEPVKGWAEVAQYYQRVVRFLEQVRTMVLSDVSVDV